MENQEMNNELTQGQAVNVLIQAVRIAQGKGAYTLEDAELVARAVKVFVPAEAANQTTEDQTQSENADPVINQEVPNQPVVEKVG